MDSRDDRRHTGIDHDYSSLAYGVEFTAAVFFFFQAEDGIRDVAVTGVQTCALPIYRVLGVQNVCPPHSLIDPIGRAAAVGEFVAVIHMFDPDLHAQLPGVVILGKFGEFFPREPKPPIDVRLLVRQQNAAAPATGQHPPSTIFGVALHTRFANLCDSRSRTTARGTVGWTEDGPR